MNAQDMKDFFNEKDDRGRDTVKKKRRDFLFRVFFFFSVQLVLLKEDLFQLIFII